MFVLTIKELAAHKLRLLTTAFAVLLGVAFMSGTLIFTDTIGATFDSALADVDAGVDAYVRTPSDIDTGYGQGPRLDASIVDTIAAVDGVDQVALRINGYARLVGPDGTPVGDVATEPGVRHELGERRRPQPVGARHRHARRERRRDRHRPDQRRPVRLPPGRRRDGADEGRPARVHRRRYRPVRRTRLTSWCHRCVVHRHHRRPGARVTGRGQRDRRHRRRRRRAERDRPAVAAASTATSK
jgi:hypothetical protein